MKNILIISDNVIMTEFFINECNAQEIRDIANFKYCYTITNKNPLRMKELGATVIDMKDHKCIAMITKQFDLVISMHCKQIFPKALVDSVCCINVHPGFNPHNRGWYPQVFSIINGKPIGASIHVMDEHIDHGGLIDQMEVIVNDYDTSLDVYERIIDAEKTLISKNLKSILQMDFNTYNPPSEGNYNSINDFKSLCEIDMNSVGTFRHHINILRALTHGEFKNCYFYGDDGTKIFVKITLSPET